MKLAEALIKIKDLKGKCSELQKIGCLETTFEVVDEEIDSPNIEDSLELLVSLSEELSLLKLRITKTNVAHRLSEKLYKMEHFRSIVSKLSILSRNKQSSVRLSLAYGDSVSTKIETRATYNVKKWTQLIEEFKGNIRKLDLDLQKLNWEVDLVD